MKVFIKTTKETIAGAEKNTLENSSTILTFPNIYLSFHTEQQKKTI